MLHASFLGYPSWIIWLGSDCDLRIVTGRAALPDLLSPPPLFPLFRAFVPRPSVPAQCKAEPLVREECRLCCRDNAHCDVAPVALHLRGGIWTTRSIVCSSVSQFHAVPRRASQCRKQREITSSSLPLSPLHFPSSYFNVNEIVERAYFRSSAQNGPPISALTFPHD